MKKVLIGLAVLCLISVVGFAEELVNAYIKLNVTPCAGCISRIETAVAKIEGVKTVQMNPKNSTVQVEYVKDKTDVTKIEAAIAAFGFDAGNTKAKNPHKCSKQDCSKKPSQAECCPATKAKASCCTGDK